MSYIENIHIWIKIVRPNYKYGFKPFKIRKVFHTFSILLFRKWEIPFWRMLQHIHKLIYNPIFSSAICNFFSKLNSFMATQTKDELYFSPHAYLSTCNAVTIISSLYICTSSRKRPKYLFPPSIKIRYVFLVKEIRLLYEFRIPVSATDFANFLVFLYYFSYSWFTVSHFLLQLKKENEKKG